MRIKRPGPGISRGYNSLAGQSLGLTMGKEAPPDLMESLGFGPLETGDDPYWTEGFGPVHAHPNLWPDDMPGVPRGDQRLLARDGGALHAADAHLRACARPRRKLLRQPQRPSRHQHAHQLLSGAGARRPSRASCAPARIRTTAPSPFSRARTRPAVFRCCAAAATGRDVPMVEDGFIINIGDLLMRWTNDRWVSTHPSRGQSAG